MRLRGGGCVLSTTSTAASTDEVGTNAIDKQAEVGGWLNGHISGERLGLAPTSGLLHVNVIGGVSSNMPTDWHKRWCVLREIQDCGTSHVHRKLKYYESEEALDRRDYSRRAV